MKQVKQITAIASIVILIASCGGQKKNETAAITDKRAAIEKLKKERSDADAEIRKLQDELMKIDSNAMNEARVKLVIVAPVGTQDFKHYIDLRGKIEAENNSYISPRGMGGQVRAVYVKEGQVVRKGQLLLKLDDAIARQSVVAARQQQEGVRTQLGLARSIYDRKKNLWEKGIGTEVELLSAKTNVEGLEAQLKAMNEQANVAVEQLNTSSVYSDVNGVADVVNIRVGEFFQGMTAQGTPQIKIVNKSSLKAVANIPENYISRVQKGTPVLVSLADVNKTINTSISLISQSIDPTQRGFLAEAKIPADASLKPDQSVVMKIMDYSANAAVVIPVNTIQSDEKNKYVYVLEKAGNGRSVARKKIVSIGEIYGEMVEVKSGLSAGEQLITEGYQNLYEGQLVSTEVK